MTITDLIRQLEMLRDEYGDLEVFDPAADAAEDDIGDYFKVPPAASQSGHWPAIWLRPHRGMDPAKRALLDQTPIVLPS